MLLSSTTIDLQMVQELCWVETWVLDVVITGECPVQDQRVLYLVKVGIDKSLCLMQILPRGC